MRLKTALSGLLTATVLSLGTSAYADSTLRLLTWGSYAPDELIDEVEGRYPEMTGEVAW